MIRDFHTRDTTAVLAMVEELVTESPMHARLPYDPLHVASIIQSPAVKGWVADVAGSLRGYCLATLVPSLLGPGLICTDVSVFVRKPFRNGLLAARFVRTMDDWGRRNGVMSHQHVVSTGHARIDRLYERFGYTRVGSAFMKVE